MPPEALQPLLAQAALRLAEAGCDTPQLDARLLLQSATGLTRADMILEPSRLVEAQAVECFRNWVARRAALTGA